MQNAFTTPSTILLPTVRRLVNASSSETATQWIGHAELDIIATEEVELQGFQLYAVEKWIVERTRPIISLVIQTGDASHKIKCTALKLSPSLSKEKAKKQWDTAMAHLRRGGTRPVQTEHGVVFTTSLAHFRSDYTIVVIPNGDFLAAQPQLYSNINLLRMGCTGTKGGAVGLEEPSESVKERFIAMYHLPEYSTVYIPGADSDKLSESPVVSHSKDETIHAPPHPPKSALLPAANIVSRHHSSSSIDQSRSSSLPIPTNGSFSLLQTPASPSRTGRGMHNVGDTILPVDESTSTNLFPLLVLELGKLIQAALLVCGMLKVPATKTASTSLPVPSNRHSISAGPQRRSTKTPGSRSSSISGLDSLLQPSTSKPMELAMLESVVSDGLLCDISIEGIKTWTAEVGEPLLEMEHNDKIAHPVLVSGLLSLVLSMRNKIHMLGYHHVPKDPFLKPHAFIRALAAGRPNHSVQGSPIPSPVPTGANTSAVSLNASSQATGPTYFSGQYHLSIPGIKASPSFTSENSRTVPSTPEPAVFAPNTLSPSNVYLSRAMIHDVNSHYAKHFSHGDGPGAARKVGRALLRRVDDLGKRSGPDSNLSGEEEYGWNSDGNQGDGHRISGPLLNGIGNFASGLGLSGLAGGKSGKAGDILEPQLDLETLIKGVIGKDKAWKSRNDKMAKRRSRGAAMSGTFDVSHGQLRDKDREAKDHERDMIVVSSVGGCMRGLWSGRCGNVILLREREAEREMLDPRGRYEEAKKNDSHRKRLHRVRPRLMSPASDDDAGERSDPKSSDPEDSLTAGLAPWGGKVQRKIEAWAWLSRKKAAGESLDFHASKHSLGRMSDLEIDRLNGRPQAKRAMSASPTFRTGEDSDNDIITVELQPPDPDLVTPRAESLPSKSVNKALGLGLGLPSSRHDQTTLAIPGQKRPWGNRLVQTRVSSWSDPVSAREDIEDGANGRDNKPHNNSSLPNVSHATVERPTLRLGSYARRRRSFHTLDTFRDMTVLTPSRMKIDVELAAHFVVLWRRQEHLRNLATVLTLINQALPSTNDFLRAHVESQSSAYADAERRTKIIADIEDEKSKADAAALATNSVTYASRQFNIPNLYDTANTPRQRTFAMRESIFGTGGRKVPQGIHGAHGPYNRVQWTLDGRKRLVDELGRTESEAEEEEELDPEHEFVAGRLEDPVEDEGVVRNRAIKPVWLLGWFKGLGSRWTTAAPESEEQRKAREGIDNAHEHEEWEKDQDYKVKE
ncbi:hypothetical protein DL96DRAFT_1707720 [Flagelloscypha sp. PMI_526]|nr:hypothetical protein DL96DRAFT_1707720 [Flagelloscypha sp. PMI_526]